jgi:probable HAF family extracellular repeat protein
MQQTEPKTMSITPRLLRFAAILSLTCSTAVAQSYTTTVLQYPGATNTYPKGQNDSGTVVGYWNGNGVNFSGWIYQNGTLSNFGPANARPGEVEPTGINNKGNIVGFYVDTSGVLRGFFYTASTGKFKNVDLPGSSSAGLEAINNKDVAVGVGSDSAGYQELFTYKDGKTTPVIDNQTNPVATAINDKGTIVGYTVQFSGDTAAFTYENGIFAYLPFNSGISSTPWAVNTHNVVVGSALASNLDAGFIYTPKGKLLLRQGPEKSGDFGGINDAGVIVGQYEVNSNIQPWIYNKGKSSTFTVSGLAYAGGTGINNAGQIIGTGLYGNNGVLDVATFVAVPSH